MVLVWILPLVIACEIEIKENSDYFDVFVAFVVLPAQIEMTQNCIEFQHLCAEKSCFKLSLIKYNNTWAKLNNQLQTEA